MSSEEKYMDLGCAKLDLDREQRTGFKEVVFCQGKEDSHLIEIYQRLYEKYGEVFGTRASLHQKDLLIKKFGKESVYYDEISHILKVYKKQDQETDKEGLGLIAVCSAGTADIRVAEEASQTAEYFGSKVSRFYDVGVAGIHRLLDKTQEIQKANVVIAVAGMEGALGSVIGGLVKVPVICVPTSVGYGASFEGLSALLTMINSCANGLSVVNIDNGYGAGYIATQINRLAEGVR